MRAARLAAFAILATALAASARAELFDSVLCRALGCVLVTNGSEWELYTMDGGDGRRARLWVASAGAQPLGPVRTGTLDPPAGEPGPNQGSGLGIDIDGDGDADLRIETGGDGFLDAGDRLGAFPLTASSSVSLAERELRHSFWVASDVPFAVHAQARLGEREGELGEGTPLGKVEITIDAQAAGSDGDLAYGGASSDSGFEPAAGVRTLADLTAGPVRLFELTRPTVAADADLPRQLVRITCTYRFAGYDLSQGTGGIGAQVEYFVYQP